MTPFEGTNRNTSPTGPRTYVMNGRTVRDNHPGNDFVPTKYPGEPVPEAAWTVRECTGGVVKEVGYNSVEGHYVRVQSGSAVVSSKHMKTIVVKKGQAVAQGDTLGVAGNTGSSQARHLHIDVKKNGVYVDPSSWTGLPNKKGTYPGNNQLDGPAAVPPQDSRYLLTVGPASEGDKKIMAEQAAALGLPCKTVEVTE